MFPYAKLQVLHSVHNGSRIPVNVQEVKLYLPREHPGAFHYRIVLPVRRCERLAIGDSQIARVAVERAPSSHDLESAVPHRQRMLDEACRVACFTKLEPVGRSVQAWSVEMSRVRAPAGVNERL